MRPGGPCDTMAGRAQSAGTAAHVLGRWGIGRGSAQGMGKIGLGGRGGTPYPDGAATPHPAVRVAAAAEPCADTAGLLQRFAVLRDVEALDLVLLGHA